MIQNTVNTAVRLIDTCVIAFRERYRIIISLVLFMMRVQDDHAHAHTSYDIHIGWKHYLYLIRSVIEYKYYQYKSLTVHLPFEIQHPNHIPQFNRGLIFICFGEWLKKMCTINLYWENAPLLETTNWTLRYGNTNWDGIPPHLELCFDTGHEMLATATIPEARNRIRHILKIYRHRIKNLHIHENDLSRDLHQRPKKVLTKPLLHALKKNRTYIYEKAPKINT